MHEFSKEIWFNTYKYNDKDEQSLDHSLKRVATAVAAEDGGKTFSSFLNIMVKKYFCPGGRILANAGTHFNTQLFNCYTSPTIKIDPDSIYGILENLKIQCLTLRSEGGWGEDFTYLRPRGALIRGLGVETPGAVRYMELYNKTSDILTSGSGKEKIGEKGQKNRIRKGAQMGLLHCLHPDIEEFIAAKRIPNKLDKFNVSTLCNNWFMDKVVKAEETGQDEIIDLYFPVTTHEKYKTEWDGDLDTWYRKGYPVKVYKQVSVLYLWDLIMTSTFNFNDPGIIFIDRANETYLANYEHRIHKCNACSEQTMPDASVCDLGSLVLPFLLNENNTDFDYDKVRDVTKQAVNFLDNINSISDTPYSEYTDNARKYRRIGLGIMGWGSALYLMKVRFGSDKAEEIKHKLMTTLTHAAVESSIDLAEAKGAFHNCQPQKLCDHQFIKSLNLPQETLDRLGKFGLRNSSLFSIQPTGNTSILMEIVSGGCEPVFMHEYIRTVILQTVPDNIKDECPKYWQGEFVETNLFKFHKEGMETILRGEKDGVVYKIDKNRGLTKEVLCEDYGVRKLKELGEWDANADWAVTTEQLSVDDHIKDLNGWTKWLDASASKTINIPNNYSYKDFKKIYLDAYKTGTIKGITTYRAGTMTSVLSSAQQNYGRPKKLACHISYVKVKGEKFFVAVGIKDDHPYEIFAGSDVFESHPSSGFIQRIRKGKYSLIADNEVIYEDLSDLCSDEEEALARMTSIALRNGVPIQDIVSQLEKSKGSVNLFSKVVNRILRKYLKDSESKELCPECSDKLLHTEGCLKCKCGYSKC